MNNKKLEIFLFLTLLQFGCKQLPDNSNGAQEFYVDTHNANDSSENITDKALIVKAKELVSEDRIKEAIGLLEKHIKHFPKDYHMRLYLTALQLQSLQSEKAEANLLQILKMRPDNSKANLLMGYCLEDLGKEGAAIPHFNKTLDISENTQEIVSAHLGLASIYGKQGKLTEAEEHYNAVLSINPQMRAVIREVQKELLWERSVLTEDEGISRLARDKKRRKLILAELEKLKEQ